MMNTSFDHLTMLVSTDCFVEPLLGDLSQRDRELIQQVARTLVYKIVDGGSNYFSCADFSTSRLESTRKEFYSALHAADSSEALVRMRLWDRNLAEKSDALRTAELALGSIAARLFWLDSESLEGRITDELFDCVSIVEEIGLAVDFTDLKWKRLWVETRSKWDMYLKTLLDEVPEVPYLTFRTLQESGSQLAFLTSWKDRLGEKRFRHISRFINREIEVELEPFNSPAAAEARRILQSF